MIRTEQYKLVHRYPADPRESINLFDDPAHQPIVTQLTKQLEAYFTTYEDSLKSGLRVKELPRHNFTEAWRDE